MARKRYAEEQTIGVLQEAEAGTTVAVTSASSNKDLTCKQLEQLHLCQRIALAVGQQVAAYLGAPFRGGVRLEHRGVGHGCQ